MPYPNLSAEMKRFSISQTELADGIDRSPKTVSRWLSGESPMSVVDAFRIQQTFFPELPIDYLFSSKPTSPPT